jgi:hypothetical protein
MTQNLEDSAGVPLDLMEAENRASEDVVAQREEALAKQLDAMKKRKQKLVDPLQFEISIQAEDLSGYVPAFGYQMAPASDSQLKTLEKFGILPDGIENAGKAEVLINRLAKRKEGGLSTPRQIRQLEGRGFRHVGTWTFDQANAMISRIAARGWRGVPPGVVPQTYVPE